MQKKELLREAYATYLVFWLIVNSRLKTGTNIFRRDWDVLLILDACRTDAMREVQGEYDFIDDVGEIWSVGSTSKEWVEQTFTNEYENEIKNTAYVTGNLFSNTLIGERKRAEYGSTHDTWIEEVDWPELLIRDDLVNTDSIGHIEPLWGDGQHTPEQKSNKPPSITDHTIEAARTGKFDRVIAHYMQPHSPYYASTKEYAKLREYELHPFKAIKNGVDRELVWDAYLDNLRYVLDHVEKLLENVDGKVVITADHGDLLGDNGMYYHMPGNPHPKLKKVPWVEVEGEDKRTIEPDVELTGLDHTPEVTNEQLKALGYL